MKTKSEIRNSKFELAVLSFFLLLGICVGGCVSKSKAQSQARVAYLAGQQDMMRQMQQQQMRQSPATFRGPGVTFMGPVQNNVVPWREGMTLAQAVVSAQYTGNGDPSGIVIYRSGQTIPIDPKQLLAGQDVPLELGDVVELQPGR